MIRVYSPNHEAPQQYDEHHALKQEKVQPQLQQGKRDKKKWYFIEKSIESVQNYMENRNCMKCIVFLLIFLFIITLYQQKAYLIKKQRTFQFFIEKIHKDRSIQQTLKQNNITNHTKQDSQNIKKDNQTNNQSIRWPQIHKDVKKDDVLTNNKTKLQQIEVDNKPEQLNKPSQVNIFEKNVSHSEYGISQQRLVQGLSWIQIVNSPIKTTSIQARQQQAYYQNKYKTSFYTQHPFCVILQIDDKNEGVRINSIQSIRMQNYINYHIVVVIDDQQNSKTQKDITLYMYHQQKIDFVNYKIIKKSINQGKLEGLRMAAQQCLPEQIMMVIQGEDQLIGRQVLQLYNAAYQQSGAWFVYSNSLTNFGTKGQSKPIPLQIIKQKAFRRYNIVIKQLKSFYTFLFNNIKEQDFMIQSKYINDNGFDAALCFPILEMSQNRILYIPQLTYLDRNKPLAETQDSKKEYQHIRHRNIYSVLNIQGQIYHNINSKNKLESANQFAWFKQVLLIQEQTQIKDIQTIL